MNDREDRDIFERLYAVRPNRIRESEKCRTILNGFDRHNLLGDAPQSTGPAVPHDATDGELLAALGVEPDAAPGSDVAKLVHVRSTAERAAAEDVARRARCVDFETFRPEFERVQREWDAGERQTIAYERREKDADNFEPGALFIISGQRALIASAGESVDKHLFPGDRRLRVIFDNGTEADLWLRSLKRAL